MSISEITHRISTNLTERRDHRALERAIANAPTQASRVELEMLTRR